jgi:hypothetical protein
LKKRNEILIEKIQKKNRKGEFCTEMKGYVRKRDLKEKKRKIF